MEVTIQKPVPKISLYRTISTLPRIATNPIPVILENFATHGDTYMINRATPDKLIFTRNPTVIEHVLQKNNRNYWKSKGQTLVLGRFLGRGLLTSNGDYWLQQRRLIQPGFHKKKLIGFTQLMQAEIEAYDQKIQQYAKTNQVFDASKEMIDITFKVVSRCLFSTSFDEEALGKIEYIVAELQKFMVKSVRLPFLKPWLYLSGQDARADRLSNEGDQLIFGAIQERKASGEQFNDLLDMLLETRYEDTGEGMTEKQLRDESLILFTAGHETSANALSWTLYLLAQHPEVEQKLLEEFDRVLGDKAPAFEHLPQLEYTLMVIKEGMRLYPPAWITDRVALEDDEVEGFFIPKGAVVLSSIYGVHHSPEYWENPEDFIPERFDKERMKNQAKFTYLPFGGGPRLCIGNNFALMEMQLILANLYRKYKWELVQDQKIELQPLVTLRPRYGIKMRISER